ncbi:MAG: dTDP-4-dehydrorhamnose 3,5-epimerase family protein [Nanoarchaeota archaeon]
MAEIDGVVVKPLRQIFDDRGKIMHMMKATDQNFVRFGEVYFSTVNHGVVKAWHLHKKQTDNFACIKGMIKLVLYDAREGSKTKGKVLEVFMGEQHYALVNIPPGVIHGMKGISIEPAIVANCCTDPYSEDDEFRIDAYDTSVPYDWRLKDK